MKSALSDLLNLADEKEVADGQHSPEFPHAVSLDDRANLYLNAVHGAREFSSDEYKSARNLLLDAMVANIGTDTENGDSEGTASPHPDKLERGRHAMIDRLSLSRPQDVRFEDSFEMDLGVAPVRPNNNPMFSVAEPFSAARKSDPADVTLAALASALSVGDTGGRATRSQERSRASDASYRSSGVGGPAANSTRYSNSLDGQTEKRRLSIRSMAIGVSFGLMIAIAAASLYFLPGWDFPSTKSNMVAQSSREGMPDNSMKLNQLRQIENSVPADRLVGLGERLASEGDFYAARLILTEAAKERSADAAFSLGKTFDPYETRRPPDASAEAAKAWYERAKLLGSSEAQPLLDRLAAGKR